MFDNIVDLLLFVIAYPYLLIRLSLMAPMQATGKGGWAGASLRMSQGNGLRMLLTVVLVNLPLLILLGASSLIALFITGLADGELQAVVELESAGVLGRLLASGSAAEYMFAVVALVLILIIAALYTIFSYALNASAIAFIYKALERGRAGD